MDVIAEDRLDFLYPDGELVSVNIRIGRPRPHPAGKGDWGCTVQALGLRIWEGPTEFFGEGSLQALMLASTFVYRMLTAEIEGGAVPHHPGGGEAASVDVLFGKSAERQAERTVAGDQGPQSP